MLIAKEDQIFKMIEKDFWLNVSGKRRLFLLLRLFRMFLDDVSGEKTMRIETEVKKIRSDFLFGNLLTCFF